MTTPASPKFASALRAHLRSLAAFIITAFALIFTAQPARAQTAAGTVAGTVIDSTTGKYLEGAEITIDGTALRAVSARDGSFALTSVPAGPRNVTVTYPGLEAKSSAITVQAGQTARCEAATTVKASSRVPAA